MSDQEFVKHATLAEALRAVMVECAYVQKKVKIQSGGNYSAVGEADVIAAVRPAMIKHGVVGPIPTGCPTLTVDDSKTSSDKFTRHCVIIREYVFLHADTDQTLKVVAAGEANDAGDKAVPKANTSSYKAALRNTFCLETGEDPDYVASERGADNAPEFRRAATAIESAANVEALDKIARHIVKQSDTGDMLFDEEQIEKLNKRIDERKRSFPGQAARPVKS